MLDIGHFQWVNDTHGHPSGDAVLRQVADTLTRCFMRRDDFFARYGGEEFAIVLRILEIEFGELEEPIRITVSIGIARLLRGGTAAAWIEHSDRTLYRTKNGGLDQIELDPIDLDETSARSGLKTHASTLSSPLPLGVNRKFG